MAVTVLHGDCRKVLPELAGRDFPCAIVDPPYGDTSLSWDRRCDGWVEPLAATLAPAASVWVFGSMRYLATLFGEFEQHGFRYSQDIVWEKQNGTGFHDDRFRRVHEHAVMFYRGLWRDVYHDTQYEPGARAKTVRRKKRPTHTGHIEQGHYTSVDGGPLMVRSVLYVPNEHGRAIHPTQKPVDLLIPLLRYSCPPGGTAIDTFSGSGSLGVAANATGRDAVLIEGREEYVCSSRARLTDLLSDLRAA